MTVKVTEKREVELSKEEALRVTRAMLRERLGLPTGSYIENGQLMQTVEDSGGSHRTFTEKTLRPASELDAAGLRVLAALK